MKKRYLLLLLSTLASSAMALDITGLAPVDGPTYASAMQVNKNLVSAIENYAPSALAAQLIPFLPATPAGAGRTSVLMVEPQQDSSGEPSPTASGAALASVMAKASSSSAPVTVLVDPGQYTVASLAIPANVTLEGLGNSNTIINITQLNSSAPLVKSLTINSQTVTITDSGEIDNSVINGALILNGGNVMINRTRVNGDTQAAISVGSVSSLNMNNDSVTSRAAGMVVNDAVPGLINNTRFVGATTISLKANAPMNFFNDVFNGAQAYFGDNASSAQHCHNDVDENMSPLPNAQWAATNSCIVGSNKQFEQLRT
jgi:hypothetical protein